MDTALFLRMAIAHIIADFFIQTSTRVENRRAYKYRSNWLYVHGVIVFALTTVLSFRFDFWWLFLCLSLAHIIIDGIKSYLPEKALFLVLDQAAHFLTIFVIWGIINDLDFCEILETTAARFSDTTLLIYSLSILAVTYPVGYLIRTFISRWNIKTGVGDNKGLENAGFWIGCFERILIVIFVCFNRWEAIGLLITAKSIIRFGEDKSKLENQSKLKYSEYILLGSLLSFLSAIIIGLIAKALIQV